MPTKDYPGLSHTQVIKIDLALPIVHLNGTSREALVEQRCTAMCAVNDAYRALQKMAPNGRDYYPAGPEQFERARVQHESRLRLIDQLRAELEYESIAIDEA